MFSVCIIARDEEKNMERCLEALQILDTDVVVVDTGSIDQTKELAKKFACRVYDYEWKDDFAAAKNFAISKAVNDIVMVVDADEFLEITSAKEIKNLWKQVKQHPAEVGRVFRKNCYERDGNAQENYEWINRIFSKGKFHYEGRIHEQVVSIDGSDYKAYRTNAVLMHAGYDLPLEERRRKASRNIRLLERELEDFERDEEQCPYILYQLGKSYFMSQDYEKACAYFSQGLSFDLNPEQEYVIDMVETYGYALLNSGQEADALLFESIYSEFGGSADFQFLMGLIYMKNAMFEKAVEEFLKAVKHEECRVRGVNSYSAYYNIGVIYECLGNKELAREFYKKSGDYRPARERLKEI